MKDGDAKPLPRHPTSLREVMIHSNAGAAPPRSPWAAAPLSLLKSDFDARNIMTEVLVDIHPSACWLPATGESSSRSLPYCELTNGFIRPCLVEAGGTDSLDHV